MTNTQPRQRTPILPTIACLISLSCGLYGGYMAGQYKITDSYQREALARGFGHLEQKTLAFQWNDPLSYKLPESSLQTEREEFIQRATKMQHSNKKKGH